MRPGIDNGNVPAAFARDVNAGTVRQKCDRSGSSTNINLRDHALLASRNREHLAFVFTSDIDFAIHRVHAHALRFGRHFYFSARLARIEIHNQSARIILICDEREFSVSGNCKLLRIGRNMPSIGELSRDGVNYSQAIRCLVRRRALGIHARRHARGAAQRDQDAPAIRRSVNSAWSLAYPENCNNSIRRAVNDTYIPRSFVANIHEIVRRFGRSGQRDTDSCSIANRQSAESHILPATSHRLSEQVRSRCRSSKLDVRCSLFDVCFNANP